MIRRCEFERASSLIHRAGVDRVERSEAFQRVYDRILAATTPAHLPASGAYVTDANAISSAARGTRRPADTEADVARQLLADAQASAARASQEPAKADGQRPPCEGDPGAHDPDR